MGSIREQWTYRNSGKKTNISRFFSARTSSQSQNLPIFSPNHLTHLESPPSRIGWSDLAQAEGSTWSLASHQSEKPWGPQRSHLAYPLSYHKRKCVKINVCKWKYMPSTVCRELLAKTNSSNSSKTAMCCINLQPWQNHQENTTYEVGWPTKENNRNSIPANHVQNPTHQP
jgi:hypothetical protein